MPIAAKHCASAYAPAGFHNASLYGALRPAVPPLVALLRDDEDRTRANAAGALGNLVRNSSMLCPDIMQAGALEVCPARACHIACQACMMGGPSSCCSPSCALTCALTCALPLTGHARTHTAA